MTDFRRIAVDEAIPAFYDTLYSAESEEETGEEPPPLDHDPFMESLARGTCRQIEILDGYISQKAEHWRLDRMPLVDRNILRMAIYEMKDEGTPPAVVIDEALELARRYTEEEAIPFLNGVLDSVRKMIVPETPPAS